MCCSLPSGQWSKVLGIHLLPRRPWENKYEHQLIVSVENERTYERVKPSGCMSALIILRSVTGPMAAKVIEEKPSNVNEIKWLQRMLKKTRKANVSECRWGRSPLLFIPPSLPTWDVASAIASYVYSQIQDNLFCFDASARATMLLDGSSDFLEALNSGTAAVTQHKWYTLQAGVPS